MELIGPFFAALRHEESVFRSSLSVAQPPDDREFRFDDHRMTDLPAAPLIRDGSRGWQPNLDDERRDRDCGRFGLRSMCFGSRHNTDYLRQND